MEQLCMIESILEYILKKHKESYNDVLKISKIKNRGNIKIIKHNE